MQIEQTMTEPRVIPGCVVPAPEAGEQHDNECAVHEERAPSIDVCVGVLDADTLGAPPDANEPEQAESAIEVTAPSPSEESAELAPNADARAHEPAPEDRAETGDESSVMPVAVETRTSTRSSTSRSTPRPRFSR